MRSRIVKRVLPGVSKDRSAFNFRVKDSLTLRMKAVRYFLTSAIVPCYVVYELRRPRVNMRVQVSVACSVGLLVLRGDSFHGESTGSISLFT
jgi:hypothetical protein